MLSAELDGERGPGALGPRRLEEVALLLCVHGAGPRTTHSAHPKTAGTLYTGGRVGFLTAGKVSYDSTSLARSPTAYRT